MIGKFQATDDELRIDVHVHHCIAKIQLDRDS